MSAPKVFVGWWPISGALPAYWQCQACDAEGEERTIAAAADAGRAHLAAHHTAHMPPVAHGDPYGLNVAQNRAPQAPLPYSSPLDRAHNEGSRR